MAHWIDYLIDSVKNSQVDTQQSSADTAQTVTRAAVAGRHHVILKCDASYSSSSASGELTLLFGTTVIARKDIHGAGAIDFGFLGHQNPDVNELVEAQLAAGGTGVTSDITFTTYSTGPNA